MSSFDNLSKIRRYMEQGDSDPTVEYFIKTKVTIRMEGVDIEVELDPDGMINNWKAVSPGSGISLESYEIQAEQVISDFIFQKLGEWGM